MAKHQNEVINSLDTVWEQDLYLKKCRDVRVAWRIAICAMIFAGLCLVTLLMLLPLKTSVPYILTVDSQTGYIEETSALQDSVKSLTRDKAMLKHNIAKYIIARETYDPQSVKPNFDFVTLYSAKNALADYNQTWREENNPAKLYARKIRVMTTIKSISLINEYTANVRFKTKHVLNDGKVIKTLHHAAIIQWIFTEQPVGMKARLKNPLGFKVTNYRVDQESIE